MYKNRLVTDHLKKLFAHFPVVVVTGARQVGKSTLLRHVFPDYETIVFDSVMDVQSARQEPDLFLDNHPSPLILDEIQFAGELVSAIKRRVDRTGNPGQYILTGSQQWSVLRTISESLAGRAVFVHLEGFCLSESCQQTEVTPWLQRWLSNTDDFIRHRPQRIQPTRTLHEHLWRGWLPKADFCDKNLLNDFFKGYLSTYIERDVRFVADISDWQQYGNMIQLSAALTAQEINYSKFGRDIDITPQTARRWLAVLTATFQWYIVPAFSKNTIKRISEKPKGYFADTGLACFLQMIYSPSGLGGHPLTGALFETAIAGEIRKLSAACGTYFGLYHWRTHQGAEVDFILERDGILFPIEVKLTSHPGRADTTGITAFRKTYPNLRIAPGLVIAPCERFEQISDNDYCLPCDTI